MCGVLVVEGFVAARKQFHATVRLGGYGAVAIALYFVDPLRAVEKLRHSQALHGFNERSWAKRKRAELLVQSRLHISGNV